MLRRALIAFTAAVALGCVPVTGALAAGHGAGVMVEEVMAVGTPWAVTPWVCMRWEVTPAAVTADATLPVDAVTAAHPLTAEAMVTAEAATAITDITATMDAATILRPRSLAA